MTAKERPHALVAGGTGMLGPLSYALAESGWAVSVLARGAEAFARDAAHGHLHAAPADLNDPPAVHAALAAARNLRGAFSLAVVWAHRLDGARAVALALGHDAARFFHVLGSAVADPSRTDRLSRAAEVTESCPQLAYRRVVLGYRVEHGRARWLLDAEICGTVAAAIAADLPHSIAGQVEPWDARPGA